MPYKVPNVLSYSPFGHGGGLTKAVANLFGGGNQADAAKAQAYVDSQRAAAEYHLAQRDALDAKTRAEEQARLELESAPRKVAGAIFGNQPQADLWMKSRETGSLPVAEFTTPVGSQMGPSQAQADVIPAQFDPNLVANATRMLTGIAAARALPGNDNLKHLSDIVGRLYALDTEDAIRGGKLDATMAAGAGYAAGRHANEPFKQGKFGMGNVVTGGLADPSLFNAEVATEGEKKNTEISRQQENRAQAGAAGAAARLSDARASEIGRLVPVTDPNDGKTYMVPEGKAGLSVLGRENRKDVAGTTAALKPPGAEKAPIKISPEVLRTELGRLTEEEAGKRALDPMFANQVVSRAMALAQESGGEFWNKPVEAVRVALMEATGGKDLTDITGSWRDRNKRFAPPGFKPQQSGGAITPAPAAGAPAEPAMPKVGEVRKGYRYKGGDPSNPSSWEAAK